MHMQFSQVLILFLLGLLTLQLLFVFGDGQSRGQRRIVENYDMELDDVDEYDSGFQNEYDLDNYEQTEEANSDIPADSGDAYIYHEGSKVSIFSDDESEGPDLEPEEGDAISSREEILDEDEIMDDDDENDYDVIVEDDLDFGEELGPPSNEKLGANSKITEVSAPRFNTLDAYLGEMLMVIGICVYFLCFLLGRARNEKMVDAWYDTNQSWLKDNFSLVGVKDSRNGFVKIREDLYKLWCSGRVGCEGMLIELQLDKRHDLMSRMASIVKPTPDIIQITITFESDEIDHIVMAIGTKKTVNKLVKEYEDLRFFAANKNSGEKFGFTDNSLICYFEQIEVPTGILSAPIVKLIEKNINAFEYLHISDYFIGTKDDNDLEVVTELPQRSLRLILKLKVPYTSKALGAQQSDIIDMLPMSQLAMTLLDRVRKFKHNKDTHSKTLKNRTKFQETVEKRKHSQRVEASQKKKEEKNRAVRDQISQETDPTKARKMDEKNRKKEMKRSGPQLKLMKVKA